jgi:serine/threonine-protein kinase
MSYEIGSRVGDYEIQQVLGAGGMGRVYKVRNVISDRVEAMKVLLPDLEGNPGLADRFMREIKVQASLDHPNIAALYTALRIENQLVMLMEYVEGTPLDKMMEAGPVPIDKAADYIAQVLSALSYAHARGVIHRDLKPANMMVTHGGLVKLMDFGIAKMAADRKLTQTGSTVGSLYYMSPEQINGTQDIDARSDLYSLGVSLYEIVTGARPFQGDSEYSIMAAHLAGNPPPPVQISPNLPPGLSEIILQALEKDPARRFQSADAFRAALLYACRPGPAAAAAQAPAAPAPAAPARPAQPVAQPAAPRPAQSHRGLWIAVGALVALAVIVAAAIELPKLRRTTAGNIPAAEAPAKQAPVPAPAVNIAESQTPAAPAPAQEAAPPPVTATPEPKIAPARPAAARTGASLKSSPAESPAPVVQSPLPPQPAAAVSSPQPPAAPAEDPKTAGQLKEVRQQFDLLSLRAGTVKSGLDSLRRQQAASGLGLRADMADAARRMDYYCKQTEAALGSRDPEAAKKNLDLAEREVSKLEDFLHR